MGFPVVRGTLLEISLTDRTDEKSTLRKVGRALDVWEGSEGQWIAQCQFILPLTERQWQALGQPRLRRRTGSPLEGDSCSDMSQVREH
jgi:hypothetical protein